MSDFPDITTDDWDRWYPGTNVAFDRMLEVDGFSPSVMSAADVGLLLGIKTTQLHPYEMRDPEGRLVGNISFSRETYEAWSGNAITGPQPFSLPMLERAMNRLRHHDCPLAGCEDFGGQALVPVHAPLPAQLTPPTGFDYRGGFTYLGDETARNLAAAINAPPRVLRFRNGSSITLPSVAAPGDTITLNGQTFQAADLIANPAPAYAAMEPAVHYLAAAHRLAPVRTARQHLERARPKRRLDGRRA